MALPQLLRWRAAERSSLEQLRGTFSVTLEDAVQDFINRKNLDHYRRLLAGPRLDEALHEYVSKLLKDEEEKKPPPVPDSVKLHRS